MASGEGGEPFAGRYADLPAHHRVAAAACRRALDGRELALLGLLVSNAYESQHRGHIVEGVVSVVAACLPFFRQLIPARADLMAQECQAPE